MRTRAWGDCTGKNVLHNTSFCYKLMCIDGMHAASVHSVVNTQAKC